MLKGEALVVTLRKTQVLHGVSVEVFPGRVTLFVGESGSGKTTLLKTLAELIVPTSGRVLWNDQPVELMSRAERASLIGFVAQQNNLFPHMSVLKNCTHPQEVVLKRPYQEAEAISRQWLADLGISQLADRRPAEISGGQQQRVAIARAAGMGSKVLLLDEPSSALDPASTAQLASLLRGLADKGIAVGVSSHDVTLIDAVMDRAYTLAAGKIVQQH